VKILVARHQKFIIAQGGFAVRCPVKIANFQMVFQPLLAQSASSKALMATPFSIPSMASMPDKAGQALPPLTGGSLKASP